MKNNNTIHGERGIYDVRILVGLARLTIFWNYHRENLFNYALKYGDSRWQEREEFCKHMYYNYFQEDTPITLQMYQLDPENQHIVLQYVEEVVMQGMCSWRIRF